MKTKIVVCLVLLLAWWTIIVLNFRNYDLKAEVVRLSNRPFATVTNVVTVTNLVSLNSEISFGQIGDGKDGWFFLKFTHKF